MNLRNLMRAVLASALLASAVFAQHSSPPPGQPETADLPASESEPQDGEPGRSAAPKHSPKQQAHLANPFRIQAPISASEPEDAPPPPPLFNLATFQQPVAGANSAPPKTADGARPPLQLQGTGNTPITDQMFDPEQVLHDDYWVESNLLPTRRLYVELDFLNWWTKGMYVPPLATTGPDAASLVLPNATILFGNQEYMENPRGGGRIRIGSDFGCWGCGGWEIEYFGLEQEWLGFSAGSDSNGVPFIGRPFFNINPLDDTGAPDPPAREDAELVSGNRPDEILRGRVSVDLTSSFVGAAARWKCSLGGNQGMLSVQDCRDAAYASNVDFVAGYRYLRLSEGLLIREDLTAVDLANGNAETDIDIFDRFDTMNEFHGVELGVQLMTAHRDWTMSVAGRLALGDIKQSVRIDGQTINNGVGVGGLLAQTSNIGLHQRNVFGVVPELEARLSRRISRHISISAGYNFIYWSRVVRPGDQISLDVNPELLPPPVDPITGPLRPAFTFRDSDFWAHGITLGLNIDW